MADTEIRRLLEPARQSFFSGQARTLNVASLARDSGMPRSTVQTYLEILHQTLLTFQLEAYRPRLRVKEVASQVRRQRFPERRRDRSNVGGSFRHRGRPRVLTQPACQGHGTDGSAAKSL